MKKFLSVLLILVSLVFLAVPSSTSALPYDQVVTLENKDGSWVIIPDSTNGSLDFSSTGTVFSYQFSALGLTPVTDYSLIYCVDPWPQTGSELIGTFTTDGFGNIILTAGTKDFGHNLVAAKIWLVLASHFDEGATVMVDWTPSAYLFETDLINYQYIPSGGIDMETIVIPTPVTLGMSVSPYSLSFGSVAQGSVSVSKEVTLSNTGSVAIGVSSLVYGGFYTDCLELSSDGVAWANAETWAYIPIAISTSKIIYARVNVPSGYTTGSYRGSVLFVASVAP